jgi:hypothetical protein
MKPVHAFKGLGEKNYQRLEEYLDLLLRTFDIAEEVEMLPIVLHQNNLRPMYKKWPNGEQPKWWTHAERLDIMDQTEEFCWYIKNHYKVSLRASRVSLYSSRVILYNSRRSLHGS